MIDRGRGCGIIAASALFFSDEYVKADARAGAAKQAVPCESVDDYLAFCKETGKEPQREYNSTLNVRIPSELHMELSTFAQTEGVTLNKAAE